MNPARVRADIRLEVRLVDVRSVADVEGLVSRRTMRLWPGGQRSVRLQSDYSYRRQRPRQNNLLHRPPQLRL